MRTTLGVLFLVATGACGDDPRVIPDAAPPLPDGAPDAPPDTPTQPVTLTITSGTSPQANVEVYFQNADSSLVSAAMTDANGVASAVMAPGGFVTVVNPFANASGGPQRDDLRTFAGVKPGDQLKLDLPFSEIDVTFLVPYDAAATSYQVYTPCGNGGFSAGGSGAQSVTFSLYDCPATTDVLIETRDDNGSLGFLYRANAAVTDNGTVDLSAESYAAATTNTLSYTNVPAGYTSISANGFLITAKGIVFDDEIDMAVTSGSASGMVKRPANIPGATSVFDTRFFKGTLGEHHVFEWGAQGAYALDVSGLLLPEYTTAAALDTSTRTVSWTSGTGASPDLLLVGTRVGRQSPAMDVAWQMAAPYNGTSVTLPQLPGNAAKFNPLAGDNIQIELITIKVPGGYDAVREHILSDEGPDALVTGQTGRIVYEFLRIPEQTLAARTTARSKAPSRATWLARPMRAAQ